MKKPQKLEVVQQYVLGTINYKSLAKLHGLNYAGVRLWVSLYQHHGAAGLAKKFSHYDAEFRLSVSQHMWDNELSNGQVAAVLNIRSPGSVSFLERCYHDGGTDALAPRSRAGAKKMPDSLPPKPPLPSDDGTCTREDLLADVNHLRMENAYLKKLQALVLLQQQQRATARKKRK
jgi:transposase